MENVMPITTIRRKSVMPEEKKAHLNELLNRIDLIEESESTGLKTALDINDVLKDLHVLEEECPVADRLKNADETLLDAKVVASTSLLVLKCVQAVNISNTTYEFPDFASVIRNHTTNNDPEQFTNLDLLNLIDDANNIVREVPKFCTLYGSYDITKLPEPKVRKERVKKPRQEQAVKKHLIKVVNAEKEEQGIDDTINFLTRVLETEYTKNGGKPIDYYQYVTHTKDFGQTVQNIFYTSFLVRDGKANLDVDEEGNATLEPMKQHDLKSFRKGNKQNTQLITSISMDEWQNMNIEEGLLQKYKNVA